MPFIVEFERESSPVYGFNAKFNLHLSNNFNTVHMASKILGDLKREINRLESELKTLVHAANLIAEASSGRGRKAKITSNVDSIIKALGKGSKASKPAAGKRGRPKGSKNKPGAKKTGPKVAKPVESKASKTPGKRGRKPKSAPSTNS